MTNSDSINAQDTDPRQGCEAALATFRRVAESIGPDDLSKPTPCDDMNVGQLLGHTVGAAGRLAAAGRGDDPNAVDLEPAIDPNGYVAAVDAVTGEVRSAWADPARLGEVVTLPFAQMPGAMAVGMYTAEILIHSWDLAAAAQLNIDWPDPVVLAALAGMQMALPDEIRSDPEVPFDRVVDVPSTAPAIERLVAWTGRNPAAWPTTTS